MHILKNASRRLFLRQASAMSAMLGAGAPVALNLAAMSSAAAQTASDYRAIVCFFMHGGNDAYNMFLPTDAASFAAYTSVRKQTPDSIALLPAGTAANLAARVGSPDRLGGVLPISPLNNQGRTYALHPLMGSLQTLFNTDKRLAVLSNIGPLVRPTNKTQYAQLSYPKPARLFSHNDQQNTWQALGPEGATQGWGGRMGDYLAGMNNQAVFTSVSASGNAVWASGSAVQQYQVGVNGATPMGIDASGQIFGSAALGTAVHRMATTTRSAHPFDADMANVARRSVDAERILRTAMLPPSNAMFGTPPIAGNYFASSDPKLMYQHPLIGFKAFNSVAQQLQVVARMIHAGMSGATGVRRQVFFVGMGGFDSHDGQNTAQADLLARVAHALSYFDTTLGAMGARNNVTTFTASEFGRTFTSNGDGTDHGWGAHQFVMGGAVKGGDIYGTVPVLGMKNPNDNNFNSSPDQLTNGVLLPTSSVDQLGATLGKWFGLTDSQLLDVFPNLANFDVAKRNLGFMNA
jgi:uncharacterized protein (DUF1501 family)